MVIHVATTLSAGIATLLVQGSPGLLEAQDRQDLEAALRKFNIMGEYRVRQPEDRFFVVRVPIPEGGHCDLRFDERFTLVESDCP